ncbi:MAG: FaeA/PapI family transcriptional regulator [Treponema sp.]|nr:FaeA/PapI family transcriptional regulator [Treponema sp.]
MTASECSIGTKNESSLHNSLKMYYAEPGNTEATRAGYVCDAIGVNGEVIEIQTSHFNALKKKIPALAKSGKVRLIYPVIEKKTIELYDPKGRLLSRRKSPKKGTIWDIFDELVYVPELLKLRKLTIEIIYVDAVERRCNDGKGSWRRKGVSIKDRSLENRREGITLKKKADWIKHFLPLKNECSTKTLAEAANVSPEEARKTLYTLRKAGYLEKIRKQGRSWVYRIL